jgi:excisionase family DNA binding protein
MKNVESLLTLKHAAGALAVSTRTVRRLIKDGEIVHHRIGKGEHALIRIAPDDLRSYMCRVRT